MRGFEKCAAWRLTRSTPGSQAHVTLPPQGFPVLGSVPAHQAHRGAWDVVSAPEKGPASWNQRSGSRLVAGAQCRARHEESGCFKPLSGCQEVS